MEARSATELPEGECWQFEPKWDGFRCLCHKRGDVVELRAKSGKPLGRYFPEVVSLLRGLAPTRFVLDGELVVEHDGRLSFDALRMRLHPADSRVRKLSRETPARLVLFDMLVSPAGKLLLERPFERRRAALETFGKKTGFPSRLVVSPKTRDRRVAQCWLDDFHGATDGVIAKRLDSPYAPGERAMIKVKRLRTADCVVRGFRYAAGSREVGSLLLGLYDDAGRLNHVGFTSTISQAERGPLTRRLEALRQPQGFTGTAPGAPSRWGTKKSAEWEPLRPELVVEVRFDHVTGDRFRHGAKLIRWRLDKAPRQCTFDQVSPPLADARQCAATRLS
jgi:ATP-dependent DNA ligase